MTESKLNIDTVVTKAKTAIESADRKHPKTEKKGFSIYLDHTLFSEKDLKILWERLANLVDEHTIKYEKEDECIWTGTWV